MRKTDEPESEFTPTVSLAFTYLHAHADPSLRSNAAKHSQAAVAVATTTKRKVPDEKTYYRGSCDHDDRAHDVPTMLPMYHDELYIDVNWPRCGQKYNAKHDRKQFSVSFVIDLEECLRKKKKVRRLTCVG